jgi:hypothetical protein
MTKYAMTYGLYIGIVFSLIVVGLKIMGKVHYPGDTTGMINTVIISVSLIFLGKKYRDTIYEGEFLYKEAFKLLILIVVFSSMIFGFFSYWYYAVFEPSGISSYIEQIKIAYTQTNSLTEEQIEGLMALYNSSLTPGVMAFIVFFSQTVIGILSALIIAVFVKSPVNLNKTNL